MIARVIPIRRLPQGHQFFDYAIPPELAIHVGDLVTVPLRGTAHLGVVYECREDSPFTVTAAVERVVTPSLLDATDLTRLERIATTTGSTIGHLLSTYLPAQERIQKGRGRTKTSIRRSASISPEDAEELGKIFAHLKSNHVASVACHRTLATLATLKLASIAKGDEQTLIIVPQAREAEQLTAFLPSSTMLFTGTTTDHERLTIAQAWRNGSCRTLVATRAGSLMTPKKLATIIVLHASNDEHENTRRNPRFDAREASWLLQAQTGARLVFFDDLPRLEDIIRTPLFVASYLERADLTASGEDAVFATEGAAPNDDELRSHLEVDEAPVTPDAATPSTPPADTAVGHDALRLLDLTRPLNKTATAYLAFPLVEDIKIALQSQKSVLLFYNRKGVGSYYQCLACDHIPRCGTCGSVPLPRGEDLLCPHCGTEMWIPAACLNCHKPKLRLRKMGKTALESVLRELMPDVTVVSIEKGKSTALPATPHIAVATEHFFTSYDVPLLTERYAIVADLSFDLTLVHDNIRGTEEAARRLSRLRGLAKRVHGTPYVTTYLPDIVESIVALPRFIDSELALRQKYNLPPFATEIILDKLEDGATLPAGYSKHHARAVGYNVAPPTDRPYRYHGPYTS